MAEIPKELQGFNIKVVYCGTQPDTHKFLVNKIGEEIKEEIKRKIKAEIREGHMRKAGVTKM